MEILFATGNEDKFNEATEVLNTMNIRISRVDFEYMEIRSEDINEISADAALEAYRRVKQPVFVEDAGFFLKAFNGFPGSYSKWAFSKIGSGGILRLLGNSLDRGAVFKSSIAFADGLGVRIFEGVCSGRIAPSERGESGFGYDPIFIPEGHSQTFAESIGLKNKLSHRYNSLLKFSNYLRETHR